VPERVEEQTTEGGLNLKDSIVLNSVELAIKKFKQFSPQTKISLFVAADSELVPIIKKLSIHAVEVHTGDYAHAYPHHQEQLVKIKNFLISSKRSIDWFTCRAWT
jgi:pyridoxine 5-phosphate synthase